MAKGHIARNPRRTRPPLPVRLRARSSWGTSPDFTARSRLIRRLPGTGRACRSQWPLLYLLLFGYTRDESAAHECAASRVATVLLSYPISFLDEPPSVLIA